MPSPARDPQVWPFRGYEQADVGVGRGPLGPPSGEQPESEPRTVRPGSPEAELACRTMSCLS